MVSASSDGLVYVMNYEDKQEVVRIDTRPRHSKALAFSAEGTWLGIGVSDNSVQWRNVGSGELVATFVTQWTEEAVGIESRDIAELAPAGEYGLGDDVDSDWMCFTPGLHYVASQGAARRAQIAVGGISYPLYLFASTLNDEDAVKEALAGTPRPLAILSAPPTVELLSPESRDVRVRERKVKVSVRTADRHGVDRIELRVDGVPLSADVVRRASRREAGGREMAFEREFEISEGQSELKIALQAVNIRGTLSLEKVIRVRYEPVATELYVLAVGVADYADDRLDLRFPSKDAEDLVACLKLQEGVLYQKVHCEVLRDGEVSDAALRRLREKFLLRAQPEDTILVYLAGHGVRAESGNFYFLTSAATPEDPYEGVERGEVEELVSWSRLHAHRRVLLLDTCFSGISLKESTRAAERGVVPFDQSEVDELSQQGGGLYVLAATCDQGFALEREGNGLFTRSLLDGLAGAADEDKNGLVEMDELLRFTHRSVHEKSGGRQRPTVPRVVAGENFPLARVK